jgi:hypothetical protein
MHIISSYLYTRAYLLPVFIVLVLHTYIHMSEDRSVLERNFPSQVPSVGIHFMTKPTIVNSP